MSETATMIDRVRGERGELALRRVDGHFEIISNGVFLMDTRSGASERLLVRAALDAVPPGARLLIGGLGVGFSLAEAARPDGPVGGPAAIARPAGPPAETVRTARPTEIVVVEIEEALVGWHRGPLGPYSGHALEDPRVRVVVADLLAWLSDGADTFDAICLDIDNGPDWTVFDGNAALYDESGLSLLRRRLAPGGVLAVWSAAACPPYAARLASAIGPVTTLRVAVPRGEPDVIYLARRPHGG